MTKLQLTEKSIPTVLPRERVTKEVKNLLPKLLTEDKITTK